MIRLAQKLLLYLAAASDRELARQVQYLREENRILRGKLPKRVTVTPRERNRLLKFGKSLGMALKELISIVSYGTFRRWQRGRQAKINPRPRGRPRKPPILRKLILRIALATGWGYTRILGEVKKLTAQKVSRQFVVNVLKENGLDPGPKRGEKTWTEFVRLHAATLWQCDFFAKKILTWKGWRDCFVLVFLHVETRRVVVSPATQHPNAAWVQTQARMFVDHLATHGSANGAIITRDNDSKFAGKFDDVLKAAGVKVQRLPIRSPNMQAFVERWIGSIQRECLDHFIAFGEKHLNHLVREYVAHYHDERPHQGVGNVPLDGESDAPYDLPTLQMVKCKKRLGGVLKYFERRAA